MNAASFKSTADAVNAEKKRVKELPFEAAIAMAERGAWHGEYRRCLSDWTPDTGRRDWVSEETKQKFLERGFWITYAFDSTFLHWDKKPWWRFWS